MVALLKKIFEFFVYSNFFIALVAVVMVNYTFAIFHHSSSYILLLFVFFATLCSYSFHWYLSADYSGTNNRLKWTNANNGVLTFFLLLSSTPCVYLFFQLGNVRLWVIMGGLATFIYSAPKIEARPFIWLRTFAVGKTLYLTSVWVFVTVFLPLLAMETSFDNKEIWFGINRFFLILPICVLFDRKDRETDLGQGIRNIIYQLTSKQTGVLLGVCMAIFFFSGFMLFRKNFISTPSLVLNLSGIVFILLTPFHTRKPDDLYYYFLLDGLMMLSGAISLGLSLKGL